MKMTLLKRDVIESSIEITLPAFMKSSCHYYKVISQDLAICVTDLEGWRGIDEQRPVHAFSSDNVESTEEEFEAMFSKVLKDLLHSKNLKTPKE